MVPLVMEGRDPSEEVAATRMLTGTDVDYGALTKDLLDSLRNKEGFSIHFFHRVQDLHRDGDLWSVRVRNEKSGEHWDVQAKFVFIGAGGGSLPLLQKSRIPEGRGYAGFPVSGEWLRCDDPRVSSRHNAKVYGKACGRITSDVRTPPRYAPHRRQGFSAFRALRGLFDEVSQAWILSRISSAPSTRKTILPLLAVGRDNMALTEYLDRPGSRVPEGAIRRAPRVLSKCKAGGLAGSK